MRPPVYKGKSWLGALSEVQDNPPDLYNRIHRELGPIVRIKILPGLYTYSVSSPEAMEHILRKKQANYPKAKIFYNAVKPFTGNGLLTNENNQNWHTQRKLMAPSFHHRQIARMIDIMVEETLTLADIWKGNVGKYRDITEDMMFLTLNIVSRTLFSTDVMSGAGEISVAVRDAFAYAGYRLNTPFEFNEFFTGRRRKAFKKAKKLLDQTINKMIADRIQSGELGDDMLGLLLAAKDEDTGKGMDATQLRDELLTLMIAGHETTAAALAWCWYLLSLNPDKAQKLQQAVADFSIPYEEENIHLEIPDYAKWVFEESMRLYPPAWGVPRESIEADEISGYEINKKSVITCSFYAMFRDPDIWEDPLVFDPERFSSDQVAERPKFASIPFGLGKRQCIGMNMATVEGPLILAILAKQFSLHLKDGEPPIPPDSTFALRPSRKLMMQIRKSDFQSD